MDQLTLLTVIALSGALHHVQGIAVEGKRVWVSSVDAQASKGYLSVFELPAGRLLRQVEIQDGARFHPGGISLDGASVWVPVAEYRRASTTVMQRRSKRTLALESSFPVADHIGCVAAERAGLVGGNWDSRLIYRWTRDGREIHRRDNPSPAAYQDLKLRGGALVASGNLSRDEGAVDWLDPLTLALRRRARMGKTDRGVRYNNEGMDLIGDRLYLLPEDDPSRLFVFRVARAK